MKKVSLMVLLAAGVLAVVAPAATVSGSVESVKVSAVNGQVTVTLAEHPGKFHDLSFSSAATSTLLSMVLAAKAAGNITINIDYDFETANRRPIKNISFD